VDDPLREVTVLAPRELKSTGDGRLSFDVRFEELDTKRFEAACRVPAPRPGEGILAERRADGSGLVSLVLPGDLHGKIRVEIDLFDKETGRRLEESFKVNVKKLISGGPTFVHLEGQVVSDFGISKQNFEMHGQTPKLIETVSEHVRIHVSLHEKQFEGGVPLEDLTDGEGPLLLSQAPMRVLDVHVGERLVVGRCYSRDLRTDRRAWSRLQEACAARKTGVASKPGVDWITVWDDTRFSRLLALLDLEQEHGGYTLHVENPTDYSRAQKELRMVHGDTGETPVKPGERASVVIEPGKEIVLGVLHGRDETLEFLRMRLEEVQAGGVVVPVVRTVRWRFPWPSAGGDGQDVHKIHFLGVWIPRPKRDVEEILRLRKSMLWVQFPEERRLVLQVHWSTELKSLAVASNINLSDCMKSE